MRTLGNIIWHFPYFGWLRALLYAIGGLFWCITIIGIPLGVGLFQLSLFMLAPFSKGLVSVKDLELVTGEKQDAFVKNWSLVIRILYFPFGLMAALGMIITIGVEFGTLMGIPCGLAEAKALATVFNPINKRCVPRAIAEEVERRKANNTLNKYVKVQDPSVVVPVVRENIQRTEVFESILTDEYLRKAQAKADEELKAILKNREDYSPQLIKAAEKVLLDRITGVASSSITTMEAKDTSSVGPIVSSAVIKEPEFNDDKYSAYQPKGISFTYQKQVEEQTSANTNTGSFEKTQPKAEATRTDEKSVLTFSSKSSNSRVLFSILAGVILAAGGILGYYLWYVPCTKDRDATACHEKNVSIATTKDPFDAILGEKIFETPQKNEFVATAPSTVAIGEQFRINYSIGSDDISNFEAPVFDCFEVLMGPSRSTSQSVTKTKGSEISTSSITYTYILIPQKEGSFTLPGATAISKGKRYTSNSITIKVSSE